MKDLVQFICDSLESQSTSRGVLKESLDNSVLADIKRMMANCDYDKLKSWSGEDDPDKFDIQKENEKTIIGDLENAIGTAEYYKKVTGKDFDKLGIKEKADFDSKNGDIIILDEKTGEPKYFIDVKIADNYLGAISLGSLSKFRKDDSYYLLICKKGKYFKAISHKDVLDALKSGKLELTPPANKYKGYDVDWDGAKLTSEYFIKGSAIRRL